MGDEQFDVYQFILIAITFVPGTSVAYPFPALPVRLESGVLKRRKCGTYNCDFRIVCCGITKKNL
jgi:hypothetical protein